MRRNGSQPIQANITRFPNGIKEVADYVHAKGALSCQPCLAVLPLTRQVPPELCQVLDFCSTTSGKQGLEVYASMCPDMIVSMRATECQCCSRA